MAVEARRPALTLWIGWVAATAIGQVLPAAVNVSGQALLAGDVGTWLGSAVETLPVALLEFAVLRWVVGVARGHAVAWALATVAAAVASQLLTVFWYEDLISSPWVARLAQPQIDVLFDVTPYFYAVLTGAAQGVVLGLILHRQSAAYLWVGANVVAFAVTFYATSAGLSISGFTVQPESGGMAVLETIYWGIFGALTGAALVVLTRRPVPVTAPAPAVRLPRAPTR